MAEQYKSLSNLRSLIFFSELWEALESRDHKRLAMLVNSGRISMHLKHPQYGNPLHCVARAGLLGAVQMMLRKFPSGINLQTDNEKQTPLHIAASANELEVVRALLHANANTDIPDSLGHTPLHIATINGFENIVRELLAKNASVTCRSLEGYTAMHLGTSVTAMH